MYSEEEIRIRPYARLLTMLGDQLIKNEQIAVTELIKNSYDADAEWVKISFVNFGKNFKVLPESKIIIEDNGEGMFKEVIKSSWMNPATPNKYSPNGEIRRSTSGKRIIQGEKGIGRFAMLKLGRNITLTTRPKEKESEYIVNFDLSDYDDEFIQFKGNVSNEIFLDELDFSLQEREPSYFINREVIIKGKKFDSSHNNHGTKIEISNLRGSWSEKKLKELSDSFINFSSIFESEVKEENDEEIDEMLITLFVDSKELIEKTNPKTLLHNLLNQKTVLRIRKGHYDSKKGIFSYFLNDNFKQVSVQDNIDLRGIKLFKDNFIIGPESHQISDFGDFDFDFYIFDFNAKGSSPYALSPAQKTLVRNHRVYLLRDGIRVLPYGDPDDDWLQIDMDRGTISAGAFFSNDQIVGRVRISKFGNPHLRDKTNREGLIEDGLYLKDFTCLIRSFLSMNRIIEYKEYLAKEKKKKNIENITEEKGKNFFENLRDRYKDDKEGLSLLSSLQSFYKEEKELFNHRLQRSEHLAAVGLSVETTSHDMMSMLLKSIDIIQSIRNSFNSLFYDKNTIQSQLKEIYELLTLTVNQLEDMQGLFVSSKQKPKWQAVKPFIELIVKIYKKILLKKDINLKCQYIGENLEAFCMDADILQLFINLLDNSIYWLEVKNMQDKEIKIVVNAYNSSIIVADNGPGINEEDKDFIFDAFFSTKGEEGRGLGLYISEKLMNRNGNSIRLANNNEKILEGANFIVEFKER